MIRWCDRRENGQGLPLIHTDERYFITISESRTRTVKSDAISANKRPPEISGRPNIITPFLGK